MGINITVTNLSPSDCIVLKMDYFYDFMVVCSDGDRMWKGACCESLQECIEMGIEAFE